MLRTFNITLEMTIEDLSERKRKILAKELDISEDEMPGIEELSSEDIKHLFTVDDCPEMFEEFLYGSEFYGSIVSSNVKNVVWVTN